jgi:translation elongation factor P/translation initiation factor 5A
MAKEKEIDIEEVLCENNGKIVKDENGLPTAQIVDDELDVFDCAFNGDGFVTIDTENYSYITLSAQKLHELLYLLQEAEEILENIELDF